MRSKAGTDHLRSLFRNIVMKLAMRCRQAPGGTTAIRLSFLGTATPSTSPEKWVDGLTPGQRDILTESRTRIRSSSLGYFNLHDKRKESAEKADWRAEHFYRKTSYIIFQYSQDFVAINIPIPRGWPRR
jgi:hypothetical protein